MMQNIDVIKESIKKLYENKTEIHVDVHSTKPKINVVDSPAKITGVYRNLFTLETVENGLKKLYTVQYTDLFIGKVRIDELKKQSK